MKLDPEGAEMAAVKSVVSFKGKDVLEVGCGDGRITFQFAKDAKKVVAVDPSARAVAEAREKTPRALADKVRFKVARGESLPFDDGAFDTAFLTWSLCCTDTPAQGRVLQEAWRVLRPGGELVVTIESLHQPLYSGMVTYIAKRGEGQPEWTDPERQARMALKHACYVERKFRFIAEKEFQVNYYYNTERELMKAVRKGSGLGRARLGREAREGIAEIADALRTRKGIRFQGNQVVTVLAKRSGAAR